MPPEESPALAAKRAAERTLFSLPGVHGVGLSANLVGGERTGQVAIGVIVDEKLPLSDLPPDQVIPPEIDGVPTDVIASPRPEPFVLEDVRHIRPLRGGLRLGLPNLAIPDPAHPGTTHHINDPTGTMGFLARTTAAHPQPNRLVGVTNWHVLRLHHAAGEEVFQPRRASGSCRSSTNKIGTAGLTVHDGLVDGGLVMLDDTDGQGKIEREDGNIVAVTGDFTPQQADADAQMPVWKRGAKTHFTRGHLTHSSLGQVVSHEHDPGTIYKNQIRVEVTPTDPNNPNFAEPGDSGSAILDMNNRIIGLLWGGRGNHAIASPIKPVLERLMITIVTNPPVVAYRIPPERLTDPAARLHDDFRRAPGLHPRLRVFERHEREVLELVRTNRRVTLAWHKNEGPAMLRAAFRAVMHPEERLPAKIGEVPWSARVRAITDSLAANGSHELREDVGQFAGLVAGLGGLTYEEALRTMHVAGDG